MSKTVSMRGLQTFIADIRGCSSKEAERTRVDKELGKIRKKFASSSSLSDYDKKKYIWKLLYIYMLGYDVEFGHKQASDLMPASKYAEKQVGYMATSLLLNENDEFLRLVINSVRQDLTSRNEAFQCLALTFIANMGSPEMAQLLTQDVMNVLTAGSSRPVVRKKAALALLRLLRKSPPDADLLPADVWSVKMAALLEEKNVGLLLALVTLVLGIVSRSYEGYESCVPKIIAILDRMKNKEVTSDYTYYQIPSPWLQVKCMRVLQYFPPPEDPALGNALLATLRNTITGTEVVKNVNKNNAQHAIVFEAIALALAVDADTELLNQSVALLGKFITVREPNIKYLGLENMCRLAEVPAVSDAIGRHYKAITASLSDPDVSIRRRALDVMFAMCTSSNVTTVVQELLDYLDVAELSMREELVLKTALLAERFFPNLQWYVDAMLQLIEKAGEFATRDVWFSVVQLVTNHEELHEYATRKAIDGLKNGASHESYVCCAAFLIGDHGAMVAADYPAEQQFQLLHQHFLLASPEAKALMLSTFLKLEMVDPNNAQLKTQCEHLFQRYSQFMDAELQQRAVEYTALSHRPDLARRNLLPMPKWEKRRSLLLRKLEEREGDAEEMRERPGWMQAQDSVTEGGASVAGSADGGLTVGTGPGLAAAAPKAAAPAAEIDLLGAEPEYPPANGTAAPAAGANGYPGAAAPAAQAAAAAPARTQDGLTDILDLLGEPAAPPAAAPGAAAAAGMGVGAAAVAAAADPFAAAGNAAALTAGGDVPRHVGDVGQWLHKLCIKDSGVLWEDQYLQLGLRAQYQGSAGQIMLYLGNKSAHPLTRLVCAVPPQPDLALQLGPVPQTIEPNKQVQVSLSVTCLAAFAVPPTLQLGYTVGDGPAALSQALQLPVLVSKFCRTPDNPVGADAFFARWKAIAGPPFKLTERVTRVTPLLTAALDELFAGVHLAPQASIDPEPANYVAVGTFTHGQPAMPQQVPIMVRLEVEKVERKQFQVTVASADGRTSSAVKELLCRLLAGQ